MTGKTHKYVGACCGFIVAEQLIQAPITPEKVIYSGMLVASSMVGALLLDIDKKGTTMGLKFPHVAKLLNVLFGHRGATHAPLVWIFISLFLFYLGAYKATLPIQLGLVCIFLIYAFNKFFTFIGKTIHKFIPINVKKSITICLILAIIMGIFFTNYLNSLGIEFLTSVLTFMIIGLFIGTISHIVLDSFNPTGTPWLYPFSKKKFRFAHLSEKTGIVFNIIFTILVIIVIYQNYFQ